MSEILNEKTTRNYLQNESSRLHKLMAYDNKNFIILEMHHNLYKNWETSDGNERWPVMTTAYPALYSAMIYD